MKLVLNSLVITALIALVTISLGTLILFCHHDRLVSQPDGNAALIRSNGQKVALVPGLGRVLERLRQPRILAAFVLLPSLTVISWQVRHLWRSYVRPVYSARLEE